MDGKIKEAAEFLMANDDFYILIHQSPDGDAVGSSHALWHVLRSMGKRARILCSDPIPDRFDFITSEYSDEDFEPKVIVTVDVAEPALLGEKLSGYADKVDFCIDHHISNRGYAKNSLVHADAAAACEVLFELFNSMEIPMTRQIATCLYTGIATDTGCFRFSNTTTDTHIAAAVLLTYRINHAAINRRMFEIKSKERIAIESYLSTHLEYECEDRVAVMPITIDVQKKFGMKDEDFDGLSSLALQAESVEVGITIKQKTEDKFKISFRSSNDVDVSAICSSFGGGGHVKAAGCTLFGTYEDVRNRLVSAVSEVL